MTEEQFEEIIDRLKRLESKVYSIYNHSWTAAKDSHQLMIDAQNRLRWQIFGDDGSVK